MGNIFDEIVHKWDNISSLVIYCNNKSANSNVLINFVI